MHELLCSDMFNKNQWFSLTEAPMNRKQTKKNNYFRIHCSSQFWRTAAGDEKLPLILNGCPTRGTNA